MCITLIEHSTIVVCPPNSYATESWYLSNSPKCAIAVATYHYVHTYVHVLRNKLTAIDK